ncbi:MAG TPA: hypothetical protein VGC25_05775, partial [Alphaproteobacteria bacterium]|jgi:hypothetical protein
MKISGVVYALAFALSMIMSSSALAGASGKVDKVEGEGRTVTIAGKDIKISGSRTKVMVGGKEADRGAIKAGMTCTADVDSGEAKMVDCK